MSVARSCLPHRTYSALFTASSVAPTVNPAQRSSTALTDDTLGVLLVWHRERSLRTTSCLPALPSCPSPGAQSSQGQLSSKASFCFSFCSLSFYVVRLKRNVVGHPELRPSLGCCVIPRKPYNCTGVRPEQGIVFPVSDKRTAAELIPPGDPGLVNF